MEVRLPLFCLKFAVEKHLRCQERCGAERRQRFVCSAGVLARLFGVLAAASFAFFFCPPFFFLLVIALLSLKALLHLLSISLIVFKDEGRRYEPKQKRKEARVSAARQCILS
jgi:hypothetical protein